MARQAVVSRDWARVRACAQDILKRDRGSAEGWFLSGLAERGVSRLRPAVQAFEHALRQDAGRYDAAVELAAAYRDLFRHGEAVELLERYEAMLSNSPVYLHKAAETWSKLGLHARALPLYRAADTLQPGVARLQASRAGCAVLAGEIAEAKELYLELLSRNPTHQRNHYELSRLERARDDAHIEQMKHVLQETKLPPARNIFLYYALAKELEDLERWDEAFDFYKRAGDAAAAVARDAGYEVSSDLALIDRIIEVCDKRWLGGPSVPAGGDRTPVFIVGLPRTGTTLTERIIASHSRVESADETFFLQLAIKRASGVQSPDEMSPRIVQSAACGDLSRIARGYYAMIGYRLRGEPLFIDKYPFNFLYLGFIARAFPEAHIVHLRRNAMDACFAMYKQSFFRFAYTLDDLAEYYLAYDRLSRHWKDHLGERIIEVEYESLVADPDGQIRTLLDHLGLDFEAACLDFHLNAAPSATASTVQVREKAHTRSVERWKRFEQQLEPLRTRLEAGGIRTG